MLFFIHLGLIMKGDLETNPNQFTDSNRKISKALKKYQQGEIVFKPFLLAAVLKKMHDSLITVDITDHREVLSYFGKLNKVSEYISQDLVEIHKTIIEVLFNSKIDLLMKIVTKLTKADEVIIDLINDFHVIKKISTPTQDESKFISQELLIKNNKIIESQLVDFNIAIGNLLKKNIKEWLDSFEIGLKSNYKNYDDFSSFCRETKDKIPFYLNAIEEVVSLLKSRENREQYDDVLSELRTSIEFTKEEQDILSVMERMGKMRAVWIKKYLNEAIKIVKNNFLKPVEEKIQYFDKIEIHFKNLMETDARLDDKEKNKYCRILLECFESTKKECYLKFLGDFVIKFLDKNDDSSMINDIEKYFIRIKKIEKKVSFDVVNNENSSLRRVKRTFHLSERKEDSLQLISNDFINIFEPLIKKDEDISLWFACRALQHLPSRIGQIQHINQTNKILISHVLLDRALKLFEHNNKVNINQFVDERKLDLENRLFIEISNEINQLNNSVYKRSNLDNKKFGTNPAFPCYWTINDAFKNTLQNLFEDITANSESPDVFIRDFVSNWLHGLVKSKSITLEQFNQVQEPFKLGLMQLPLPQKNDLDRRSETNNARIQKNPNLDQCDLEQAIYEVKSNNEFESYLENKFSSIKVPEKFLYFLIKSKNTETGDLFQYAFNSNKISTEVFSVYLSVVKKTMSIVYGEGYSNEFNKFLLEKSSKNGLTILHRIANGGNVDLLKFFAVFLKQETGPEKYADALREKNYKLEIPKNTRNTPVSEQINDYLTTERNSNPLENVRNSGNMHKFYSENSKRKNTADVSDRENKKNRFHLNK